ncbi:hypothetical protein E1211_10355 [Micromonospora sp. 15K316]|uniref:hypothetical protein n=1 Tax=Micromonospora sp. 15K316 TaxID=2530376 RepID=UPI001052C08C|nr:hypothetical protein [Micromonospora sp. 15K316]TDC37474.1 hypothetical protein E1211_10355 [Micromonospora sp. 15K316]
MLLDPDVENDVAYELCQLVGRAILPYRRAGGTDPDGAGTAFFFQDSGGEYLLTADGVAGAAGDLGLRASVTEPVGPAPEVLPVTGWIRRPEVGVAVLPTTGLHAVAAAGGWAWRTQPVVDVVAADAAVIARIGAAPGSAFVLAHGLSAEGDRPLEVAIERVAGVGDEVRIGAGLPAGYVGAPVFGVEAAADGGTALHCLGLVLPGAESHPVATFDRIRAMLPAGGAA